MAIIQTISTLPSPPHRGIDSREIFVTKGEAFFDKLHDFTVTEMNTAFNQINLTEVDMNNAANISLASANFKGEWLVSTTYSVPASVAYNGKYYMAIASSTGQTPTNLTYWIPYSASYLSAVELTGNQTIAGVKTFSSSPIIPTPTLGDNTTKSASTSYVLNAITNERTTNTIPALNLKANLAGGNDFTGGQRLSITSEDNAIDFTAGNNFSLTATAANITLTSATGCTGQSGVITVASANNITGWGTEFKFKNVPTGLTGTERFAYFIESPTSIAIGRVQ